MKACPSILLLLTLLFLDCSPSRGQSVSGIINTYYQVTAVSTPSNTLTVSDASGLTPGERVLVFQAKGAAITAGNVAGFGDITALNTAGGYEFNTICSINGNDVLLRDGFVNTYSAAGQVQLVTIPVYSSVSVDGKLTGMSWDPSTGKGGIVVLEATGTVTLNADIDVSGGGFQGGALVNYPDPTWSCIWTDNVNNYFLPLPASGNFNGGRKGEGISAYIIGEEYGRGKLVNGGGGGNNTNTGGGGGGNYGAGGAGGKRSGETMFKCHGMNPGIGGSSLAGYGYNTGANRIFFGGGGGSGHENNDYGTPGGNGGGIIIISAAVIAGNGGRLLASGTSPVNAHNVEDTLQAQGDGAGGGGAGGVIILNAPTITGAVTAEAKGARGSDAGFRVADCMGPGGGGGGGIVWAAGTGFPTAVTVNVSSGANGVVSSGNTTTSCQGLSNGAVSGSVGLSKAGYVPPASIGTTCTVLAISDLQYFKAGVSDAGILLSWELSSPNTAGDIRNFILQRSTDAIHFTALTTLSAHPDSMYYHYTDAAEGLEGTLYYRLVWQHGQGSLSYSYIVPVRVGPGPATFSFYLQPNPVTDRATLTVISEKEESVVAVVYNAQGKSLLSFPIFLHKGTNTFPLSLGALAPAGYFLVIDAAGRRSVKSFIKKG